MSDVLANLAKVHNLSKERDAGVTKKLDIIIKNQEEILALIKSQKQSTT